MLLDSSNVAKVTDGQWLLPAADAEIAHYTRLLVWLERNLLQGLIPIPPSRQALHVSRPSHKYHGILDRPSSRTVHELIPRKDDHPLQ